MAKKIRYLIDAAEGGHFIRAYKDRRDFIVQVWLDKAEPTGEPDGDWGMPAQIDLTIAVALAVAQTRDDAARDAAKK